MFFSTATLFTALRGIEHIAHGHPSTQYCKPVPADRHWPNVAAWQSLNDSVDGRLIAPSPPGAVCHPEWPQYNNASCAILLSQWSNTSAVAFDPVRVDYNDDTCLPDARAPCSTQGYPSYVVDAISASDVQEAVNFARHTGVRLIIKGTGHDFVGRSSGAGSLSIYTCNIRGLDIVDRKQSTSITTPVASLKIHAGERMIDIYTFASDHSVTIIGGADPHVGIGGWVSGGGHGPLTAKYGMGADQVLEMEVVTADGELRTINERSESDLFWATRGGGASTFAVLISVTVKAYPVIPMASYTFSYNTTSNSDTFWMMTAIFHSQLPRLSDSGLMGYYYVIPKTTDEANQSTQGQVSGGWLATGLSAAKLKAIVKPLESAIMSSDWADSIYGGGVTYEFPSFGSLWSNNVPQGAGFSGRLGSRLFDRLALSASPQRLANGLKTSTQEQWMLLGHLVAGPGTHNPPDGIPGGSNAIGPGWRKAYTHIVLPRIWPFLNETAKGTIATELRDVQTQALRELAPDTGSYINEVDPTEPNWKQTLYGSNYARLLEVKLKWDPKGVFWCKHCIGSDLWEARGSYGDENGVGQNAVRLCRN